MPIELTSAPSGTLTSIRTALSAISDTPDDGFFYTRLDGDWVKDADKSLTLLTQSDDTVTGYNLTTIPSSWQSYSTIKGVVIGQGVTSIGSQAFYGCSGLTSLVIGNSVTSIVYGAFYGCSGLTSLVIGNSVTSIGYYAFQNCSSLTGLVIPNSVTTIGNGAFYNCSGLTSLVIPNSVTTIGDYAFRYCSSLTTIDCYVAKSVLDVSGSLQGTNVTTIHARASDDSWNIADNPHTIGDQPGITVIKDL